VSDHYSTGVIGVLGGMGPLATVDFMGKLLTATPAASDQDHVPVVVSALPKYPTGRRHSGAKGRRRWPPWQDCCALARRAVTRSMAQRGVTA